MDNELNFTTVDAVEEDTVSGVIPSRADILTSDTECAALGNYRLYRKDGEPVPFVYADKARQIKWGRPDTWLWTCGDCWVEQCHDSSDV